MNEPARTSILSKLDRPNFWLLISLLLLMVLSPFVEGQGIWLRFLISILLVSAIHVARHRRREMIVVVTLAALWFALS